MSKKIENYFSGLDAAPEATLSWDISLAHSILRSCQKLFTELERVRAGVVEGGAAVSACSPELSATEAHVDAMIESLSGTRETSQLVHASRQTLGSLQTCVKCLTNSSVLQTADTETLKAVALALNAMATQIQKTPPMKPIILKKPNESEEVVASALKTASALAEQLRIFTRVSQQSWAATRSQLAHTPPVPSPLAAGSTPLHRRWASEDIECEVAEQTPRLLGDTPLPLHVRNRSDSRLQIGLATPPRPKHVRFQTRSPAMEPTPIIDQAHLTDLAQAVSVFEKAIAALSSAAGEPQPQNIRALATAFVQLSRLASSTGMVRHFDRPTLALFKATTHAVKQMMPRKA